jgi:hypothetical protein
MGSPTSDDDPTRRLGGPGGWQRPGQGSGYPPPGQGPSYPPLGQGGGSPPPGQGGYAGQDQPTTRFPQGDDERSHTAQFPQPGPGGGYPQQGQQGMYGPQGPYPQQGQYPPGQYPPGQYPPGQYPPAGPGGLGGPPPERSRRGLITALIAGLVILAGVGVALIFAFTRDEGDTVSADPSTSTSAPPASSSSSAPSSTPETTTSEPPPTDTAGDRTDELLAVVPPDFTDCAGADLAGDGDVAAVDCGASTTQPGPTAASFYLYDDTGTLDDVFDADAADIDPMPDGEDCTTAEGVLPWNTADGEEGGDVACTVTDDGLLIAWTDREFGIEGVVTAPGSTQEDLAALAEWWRGNSDFQR